MEIRRVTDEEYESFLQEKDCAVILFDAAWDVGPGALIRPLFQRAAIDFHGLVNFGEVDCDQFRSVKSIPIRNVPTVAYYERGRLVAALIGASQDVAARTQALLDGERIGYKDGWD